MRSWAANAEGVGVAVVDTHSVHRAWLPSTTAPTWAKWFWVACVCVPGRVQTKQNKNKEEGEGGEP